MPPTIIELEFESLVELIVVCLGGDVKLWTIAAIERNEVQVLTSSTTAREIGQRTTSCAQWCAKICKKAIIKVLLFTM
jgi:hypothetical protein